MKPIAFLGIDMAKAKFDVCLQLAQGGLRSQSFPNNAAGFDQLQHWLQVHQAGPLRVGIEATGCYWVSLAHQLHAQGWVVYLLNPAYVKAHAQSQ